MNNSKIRYMVIDDEPIAHRIIEDYCNALPHLLLVNHSHDALEAMQFLATNTVDIIFLDLNMPVMDGIEFTRPIKKYPSCKFVPLVMLSSEQDEDKISEARKVGISTFLSKPLNEKQLKKLRLLRRKTVSYR